MGNEVQQTAVRNRWKKIQNLGESLRNQRRTNTADIVIEPEISDFISRLYVAIEEEENQEGRVRFLVLVLSEREGRRKGKGIHADPLFVFFSLF